MTGRKAVALLIAAGLAVGLAARAAAEEYPYHSLAGQLLVASPAMTDPRFAETVILMISHDRDGAMGLVVNRVIGSGPLRLLLETMGVEGSEAEGTVRLFYGGPVESHRGFVVHTADYEGPTTQVVADDLAVTFETDVLHAIGEGEGPARSLVLLGYAGWGPGQLDGEIRREDWYTAPPDLSLVFGDDLDRVWERAMARAGTRL
ncbi:MAG: DUF179 domain-containing protein [Rhodospirillales bacterium]|nr:MAG: DUF179 domain-containing protein [Rhodospirillales bacterium]